MAYHKLPYNNPFSANFNPNHDKPSAGVRIRRDVAILESRATNERRRSEREAAGLTNDFKLREPEKSAEALQDPTYYARVLGELDKTNLGWDEL